MFKLGKKWDIPGCDRNPLEGVKLPQVNNLIERYLTAEETVRLKRAVEESPNPQLKNIIGLLLLTGCRKRELRSEENTSELQSLMRISYAVFCMKKKIY